VKPWSIEELAVQVPQEDFHTVSWREGSRGERSSRFAAVRVCSAEQHIPGQEEWLLIEWPKDQKAPTKYYLSSLPGGTLLKKLVRLAKLRWRNRGAKPLRPHGAAFRSFNGVGSRTERNFRGSITRPAHSLFTLRSSGFPDTTQDSLPAGGPLCRTGVEPAGSLVRFPLRL
jgi:hypothetical protein